MRRPLNFVRGAILASCILLTTSVWGATEAEKLAAIQNGLAHLYATQQAGGYWNFSGYEQAVTGAAANTFLNQQAKWPSALATQYQTAVDKAIAYLLSGATVVSVSTRNDGVNICPSGSGNCPGVYWYGNGETTYTTGLVAPVIALYGASKGATAVATTTGPLANMTWAGIAQGITNTFAAGQSTAINGALRGGWRYFPGTGDSDSSTTQWAVISLIYDQTLGAVTPAIVKTDLAAWLAAVQLGDGSVCYQPSTAPCDSADTGGWLVGKKFVGASIDAAETAAMTFLHLNWTAGPSATWYGNFGQPYAMWSIYKGLDTTIGLSDTTHIVAPFRTDCGASRSALPGNPPGAAPCNWWEDYNEWLVTNQSGDGSWAGYAYWIDPLSTAFYVNILGATFIPANVINDAYQIRYAVNLAVGDSFVNLTNGGSNGGDFAVNGDICANVYVIDPAQEVISCCACPMTPGHLKTLSAKNDLLVNTFTPGVPTAVSVQILFSKGTSCNPASVTNASLTAGGRAWLTTPHVTPSGGYTVSEAEFTKIPVIDPDQFLKLTTYCGWIQANGSGYGICKACKQGAQGAVMQ